MLNKTTRPWPLKQFCTMEGNGKLNFEMAIQRKNNIWDTNRKSLLIHSLLKGYAVPTFYTKLKNGVYEFIDGKQRMTSILGFLKDEYSLTDVTPDVDGIEIAGKKFSELPSEISKTLMDATVTITAYDDAITDDEVIEMFRRLNNGVPLKTIEVTRVLLGNTNMNIIEQISGHPFFSDKAKVTVNRYTDQEVILYLFMLQSNKDTGFSSKETREYVDGLKGTRFSDELIDNTKSTLDYLYKSFDKKKKYLKKIHLPMIFATAVRAMEVGIEPEYFGMWVEEFLQGLDKDSVYYQACQSGSARKENVQKRLTEMLETFDTYFKIQKAI